jgi:serine/threonine protein kinase
MFSSSEAAFTSSAQTFNEVQQQQLIQRAAAVIAIIRGDTEQERAPIPSTSSVAASSSTTVDQVSDYALMVEQVNAFVERLRVVPVELAEARQAMPITQRRRSAALTGFENAWQILQENSLTNPDHGPAATTHYEAIRIIYQAEADREVVALATIDERTASLERLRDVFQVEILPQLVAQETERANALNLVETTQRMVLEEAQARFGVLCTSTMDYFSDSCRDLLEHLNYLESQLPTLRPALRPINEQLIAQTKAEAQALAEKWKEVRALRLKYGAGTPDLPEELVLRPAKLTIDYTRSTRRTGGTAYVYPGEYHDQRVAVKISHAFGTRSDVSFDFLLVKELNVWSEIEHPHIVKLLAATWEPDLQMIMELMDFSLKECLMHMTHSVPTSWWVRIQLVIDVVAGLTYLHEQGIMHRDLKSANIMVSSADAHGRRVAKLSDFGATRRVNTRQVLSTLHPGYCTPAYAAPEVREGREQSLPVDIYALAVTMFEVLRPNCSDTELTHRPRPELPAGVVLTVAENRLWELIQRCWAELPGDRPTVGAVAQVLRQCWNDDAGTAPSEAEVTAQMQVFLGQPPTIPPGASSSVIMSPVARLAMP